MNLKDGFLKHTPQYKLFLITLGIFLCTFPKLEPIYGSGLDWSYKWALNYLFEHDYDTLINLVYPIGPLALLKMPVTIGDNFLISTICFSIVKFLFIWFALRRACLLNPNDTLLNSILILVSSYFVHVDFMYIGLTFILMFEYSFSRKWYLLVLLGVISTVGLCIKSSIGLTSYLIILVFLVWDFLKNKSLKSVAVQKSILFVAILAVGLIVFRGPITFARYLFYTLSYAKDYSQALSLYPDNNWWYLGSFWLSILGLILVARKNESLRLPLLLLAFPLYTSWKHAISREDVYHYEILIYFMMIFSPLLIVFAKSMKNTIAVLLTFGTCTLFINEVNIKENKKISVDVFGIKNCYDILVDNDKYTRNYDSLSNVNLEASKLDLNIVKAIGSSTVAILPFELTYVAKNKLNWRVFKTLQLGGFAQWFDVKTSKDFSYVNGPDKILFEGILDQNGSSFSSFDERLLLNDHPILFDSIFSNYHIDQKFGSFILYSKNAKPNLHQSVVDEAKQTTWNTWVEVPKSSNEILRVCIDSKPNLFGHLKSMAFKVEPFYIDYLMANDSILTYRFVPDNAKDGLWLNPWVGTMLSDRMEFPVLKFRIRSNDLFFVNDRVEYSFKHTKLVDTTKNSEYHMFLKSKKLVNLLLSEKIISYNNTLKNQTFKQIESKGFSEGFTIYLDTFWLNVPEEVTEVLIKSESRLINSNSLGTYVVSLSESGSSEVDFWTGTDIPKCSDWLVVKAEKTIFRDLHSKGELNVYIWNNGYGQIKIDDIKFKLIGN